jgi:hypothetical protein
VRKQIIDSAGKPITFRSAGGMLIRFSGIFYAGLGAGGAKQQMVGQRLHQICLDILHMEAYM